MRSTNKNTYCESENKLQVLNMYDEQSQTKHKNAINIRENSMKGPKSKRFFATKTHLPVFGNDYHKPLMMTAESMRMTVEP